MAVPRKLVVVPNSATRELWRIAESGELDELAAVLPRADINARNEHGTTALMRAARHGRVHVVRVLLERGADPNVTRNDNFTALSLAAFFGHAEIVELLMRNGANSDVVTRFGTSPQMWAKARSFGDVARCLEKRRREKRSASSVSLASSPAPLPAPATPTPPPEPTARPALTPQPAAVVIRTLKAPPEIWDLVQEAPRNFNATSAFKARIGSMKLGLVIGFTSLVVIAVAGCGAVLLLRQPGRVSMAPADTAAAAPVTPTAAPVSRPEEPLSPGTATTSQPTGTDQLPPANNVVAETPVVVNPRVTVEANSSAHRRTRPIGTTRAGSSRFNDDSQIVETVSAPEVAAPTFDSQPAAAADRKKPAAPAPVSSQLISAPKTQPKAKVIQWP